MMIELAQMHRKRVSLINLISVFYDCTLALNKQKRNEKREERNESINELLDYSINIDSTDKEFTNFLSSM